MSLKCRRGIQWKITAPLVSCQTFFEDNEKVHGKLHPSVMASLEAWQSLCCFTVAKVKYNTCGFTYFS